MPDAAEVPETRPPTATAMRRARRITLSRLPGSEAALGLTEAVVALVLGARTEGRPVRAKGMARQRDEVGRIIGGLLRSHYRLNQLSKARRRTDADMWKAPGLPIGNHAFWTKIGLLEQAGLVAVKTGLQKPDSGSQSGFGGSPAVLWPTPLLLALAGSYGVSAGTLSTDWPFKADMAPRIVIGADDLVVLSAMPRVDEDTGRRIPEDAKRVPIAPAWRADVAAMAQRVAVLNARVATVSVEGCTAPVFQRKFKGDMRLGGRLYALGDDNYQSGIDKIERKAVRIGGEPVVEVDLSASFLSIFLARMGIALPAGDPYAAVQAPREAVKALLVQSFGSGRLATRWAPNVDEAVVALGKPKPIREALLAAFPVLRDIPAVLPEDLRVTLPSGLLGWAAGQHLMFLESEVISSALDAAGEEGIVALPLHDSLVVPQSGAERAEAVLLAAFKGRFGFRVGVKRK